MIDFRTKGQIQKKITMAVPFQRPWIWTTLVIIFQMIVPFLVAMNCWFDPYGMGPEDASSSSSSNPALDHWIRSMNLDIAASYLTLGPFLGYFAISSSTVQMLRMTSLLMLVYMLLELVPPMVAFGFSDFWNTEDTMELVTDVVDVCASAWMLWALRHYEASDPVTGRVFARNTEAATTYEDIDEHEQGNNASSAV